MPLLTKLRQTRFFKYPFPGLGIFTILLIIFILFLFIKTEEQKNGFLKAGVQKEQKIASLSAQVKNLLKENSSIKNEGSYQQLTQINSTLDKYLFIKDKTNSYKTLGVDVATAETDLAKVADLILGKKYSEADNLLTTIDTNLEAALKTKQAADAAAAKKTTTSTTSSSCTIGGSGYCKTTVKASSGTFTVYVVTASLSSVEIVTDSANSDDCANNCPTKSLQNYVNNNGGYAGINGTYFCPADYSHCSSKVASYDSPVFNSNLNKWLNSGKFYSSRAAMIFNSSSATFYPDASTYSGSTAIEAGIVNYPGLVHNGASIVGNYSLDGSQTVKGTRGGVGVKGGTIYLVVASSASVTDLANIMVALGVTHALNLDGGGSSALYYNGYKVGPGRSLPNALVIK